MRHPPAGPLLPGLLLAFLFLLTGPAAAGPDPRSGAADGWRRVDTDHFILFSSADTGRTDEIGAALERLRQVLARTFTGMEVNSPLPTYIFLFRDADAFRPYRHGRDDDSVALSGGLNADLEFCT